MRACRTIDDTKQQAFKVYTGRGGGAAERLLPPQHRGAPAEGRGVLPSSPTRGGGGEGHGRSDDSLDLYVSLLQACGKSKALAEGKQVHGLMIEGGLQPDSHVGNLLVNLYTKCGSNADARHVFERMHTRDVFTWTMMIAGYAHPGHAEEALTLHRRMEQEGVKPDRVTCLTILKACAIQGALVQGKQIHSFILRSGINLSVTVGNSLIDMHAKCGSIEHAWQVFDTIPNRDAVSWNIMIAGCARLGHTEDAFSFFRSMERDGLEPDKVTFLSILKACTRIEQGKQIYDHIIRNALKLTTFVGNTLIDLYVKCESVVDAQEVFDKMKERDTLTWTMVIAGYAKNGFAKESVILFWGMGQEGVLPNEITFVSTLNACSVLQQGKQVHAQYVGSAFSPNLVVGNTLIDMYAKCGSLQNAHMVFDQMLERDIISWNTLISGYASCEHGEEAFNLFWELEQKQLEPDTATYLSVLKACTCLAVPEYGHSVHAHIIERNLVMDVFLGSNVVDMYAKCGSIEDARYLFDKMTNHDVVSWNTIMAGYVQYGQIEEAFQLFRQMEQKGLKPDAACLLSLLKACTNTGFLDQGRLIHALTIESGLEANLFLSVSFVDLYAKSGSTEDACQVFDAMAKRDVVAWNAMIAGHAEHDDSENAMELFERMRQEEVSADTVSFVGVLKACASLAAIDKGKDIHDDIIKRGLEDNVYVGSTLVDMYGKCGSAQDAYLVFRKMCERDVVTWNAMIAGYALHGLAEEALENYHQMQLEDVTADSITLVNVLSACSHAGLVIQGYDYFESMKKATVSTPTVDHYVCMVDLLGRAGLLQEALNFIESMPIQPSAVVWTALLGACKVIGNIQLGLLAAESVLELDPKNNDTTILQLSILYYQQG